MTVNRRSHVTLLLFLVGAARAAVALEPEQFVAGWALDVDGDADFYDVPLTLEVLRQAQTLEQIAILDAAGEPMPFYRVVPAAERTEQRTSLSVSPLYLSSANDRIAELRIESGDDRTRVSVTKPPDDASAEIVAFIVDARAVSGTPAAMALYWRAQAQPFLMAVRIEHSQDLDNWRYVGGGSIASLAIDGATIEHRNLPIANVERGYFRITWDKRVEDWQLERVELIGSTLAARAVTREARLEPIEEPEGRPGDALYFDLGAPAPVTAVAVEFSDDNRWGNARIDSATVPAGPWLPVVSRHLFYRVALGGEPLMSETVAVGRVEARYWRVDFAGPPTAGAALKLVYAEEPLRFAASGAPPYLLAAGTLAEGAGADRNFAAVFGALAPGAAAVGPARLGQRRELGGPAAVQAPIAFPWRSALLWAALALGVLLVAAMAVSLVRELRREPR